MKSGPYLTLPTTINSKLTKDLDLIPETIKLLEENIGENFLDTGLGNTTFLHTTPKA